MAHEAVSNQQEGTRSTIDLLAMADGNYEDHQPAIVYLTQHPVVAHPVSPEPLLLTRKRLPAHARIFETGNLVLQVVEDLALPSPVELP